IGPAGNTQSRARVTAPLVSNPSGPVARAAGTASQPASPASQPASPASQPAGPARNKSRFVWPAAAAVALAALLSVGWLGFYRSSSGAGSQDHAGSAPANPLPKQMAEWKSRADKLERVLWIDSGPLVANPHYANAAGLTAQLDALAAKTAEPTKQQLATLERDLTSMAEVQHRTSQQFAQYHKLHATADASPESREQLASQQRSLDDGGSQLLTFARRLQTLQTAAATPEGRFDAGATAELTMLREMEAATAADHLIAVKAATLDRAVVLTAAANTDLAWLAINVLARSDRPAGVRQAIQWFDTYPPDRQALLCWSLLLSGQSESIAAAVKKLQLHPGLLTKIERKPIVKLVAGDMTKYQSVLPLLLASCATGDERFELFRIQVSRMNEAWAREIEQACAAGLLSDRVEQVVLEIIAGHHQAAYPLALRLLEQHPHLLLAGWPPAQLDALLSESPELASKLAAQWIIHGNPEQRAAALSVYGDPRSKLTPEQLLSRLENDRPHEPTLLLNQALAGTHAGAARLAEFLLTHVRPLEPGKLVYGAASSAALGRPGVRTELFKLAWQASEQGRTWVLEQLLGDDFVHQLRDADAQRERQLQLLAPIVKTLDGKLVSLKNLGASAFRDQGLQLTAKEIAHVPGSTDPASVDPTPWSPDEASNTSLLKLRSRLEPLRTSADALYASTLDQLDRYLSDLVMLNTLTYELTRIYDVTIIKQLAGVRREIQLKHLESWDFRFVYASHQNFERQRTVYRDLIKSIATTRQSLAILQPATAK
ncbi:MAG TPA: hypothetical protein VIK18_26875, partial [Pirellulales bacterium]